MKGEPRRVTLDAGAFGNVRRDPQDGLPIGAGFVAQNCILLYRRFQAYHPPLRGFGELTGVPFEAFGELVEKLPGSITLKVKRQRVIPVCKALLDELPVRDIDIHEVPIEEVVRAIFSGEDNIRANLSAGDA